MTAVRNPFFARMYTRMTARENPQQVEHRRKLLAGVRGRIIEVGAGNGSNFALYPDDVAEVVAVEPEPYLRAKAEEAAAKATAPVRVVDAVADELPYEDASFDVGIASLVLCTVPDQAVALRELHRVLRPGGELRFYEHVHAHRQPLRAVLEFADRTTIWPRLAGGCHPTRETAAAIETAGFDIVECERFPFAPTRLEPPVPHILGLARRA